MVSRFGGGDGGSGGVVGGGVSVSRSLSLKEKECFTKVRRCYVLSPSCPNNRVRRWDRCGHVAEELKARNKTAFMPCSSPICFQRLEVGKAQRAQDLVKKAGAFDTIRFRTSIPQTLLSTDDEQLCRCPGAHPGGDEPGFAPKSCPCCTQRASSSFQLQLHSHSPNACQKRSEESFCSSTWRTPKAERMLWICTASAVLSGQAAAALPHSQALFARSLLNEGAPSAIVSELCTVMPMCKRIIHKKLLVKTLDPNSGLKQFDTRSPLSLKDAQHKTAFELEKTHAQDSFGYQF